MTSFMTPQVKVTPAGEHGPHARLGPGQFFGEFRRELDAGGFALAHIGADPHRDVQRHTHDDAHFIFVTRGWYVSSAQHAPEISGAPLLIYNPPGTTHRDRFLRRDDGGFDGSFVSISVPFERMQELALPNEPLCLVDTALAARLLPELRSPEPESRLIGEAVCLELLAQAARRDPFGERTAPRWLATACELLREDATSVYAIAAECGVHPVHLARTFRRFLGCTPGAYLRRCRVERATQLLRRTRLPLAEIAMRSGFADQAHMSRAFRTALAMTPAAFRRHVSSVQDNRRAAH